MANCEYKWISSEVEAILYILSVHSNKLRSLKRLSDQNEDNIVAYNQESVSMTILRYSKDQWKVIS